MEGKEKTFVTYMINGLQRIDYLIGRLSLPLEPIPLTLQLRNMFICDYQIKSFQPHPRKPAWLMDGIKWMKIKMFQKRDG
jgi:hypothetical protein